MFFPFSHLLFSLIFFSLHVGAGLSKITSLLLFLLQRQHLELVKTLGDGLGYLILGELLWNRHELYMGMCNLLFSECIFQRGRGTKITLLNWSWLCFPAPVSQIGCLFLVNSMWDFLSAFPLPISFSCFSPSFPISILVLLLSLWDFLSLHSHPACD